MWRNCRQRHNIPVGADAKARPEHEAPVGQQANQGKQAHRHQLGVLDFGGRYRASFTTLSVSLACAAAVSLFCGSGHACRHDGSGRFGDFSGKAS